MLQGNGPPVVAAGFDKFVDYLLSEIALCGVQGAGSADFHRFIRAYFDRPKSNDADQNPQPNDLGDSFYEQVWHWVSNHADIQISHKNEIRHYSLSEFKAAELHHANGAAPAPSAAPTQLPVDAGSDDHVRSSVPLLTLRGSLQLHLLKKTGRAADQNGAKASVPAGSGPTPNITRKASRRKLGNSQSEEAIFGETHSSTTAPRLYASQNRVWKALTGHGIDLRKVPSMEFILLSLIASRGVDGITQPELIALSGQDKRSVPHRTDELCRKGYIHKSPVQAGKMRTSLCVHQKFITDDHFVTSSRVEDVFQYKKFVVTGFVQLLYDTLKDDGVVLTRDIRTKLAGPSPCYMGLANFRKNVPMTTWNKRAVQGALIRLDQTGMLKRFRAFRQGTDDEWISCIQILRAPRDEDHNNLKFRRQVSLDDPNDGDEDGDALMRDLEDEMLNTDQPETVGPEDADRVPPQWIPERMLSNVIFEAAEYGGPEGWDAGMLRDRIVGKFWRRPMESYVARMADDWEKTQPPHLRHLSIIRDTRNTEEKKFVHYVYRTYRNFQGAVDGGHAAWAGVTKPPNQTSAKGKKKKSISYPPLDRWGFPTVNLKDFLGKDGSATLAEIRSAIVRPRKNGPRWDLALTEELGYHKVEQPRSYTSPYMLKKVAQQRLAREQAQHLQVGTPDSSDKEMTQAEESTNEIPLDSGARGRSPYYTVDQIQEHREQSQDPASLPGSLERECTPLSNPNSQAVSPVTPSIVQNPFIITKQDRIAAGVPPRGRLSKEVENQIREQRGLEKLPEKPPRNHNPNEPALLSKQQRIQLGMIPHGRLPQALMDGLREERDNNIPLEQSIVLNEYLAMIKGIKEGAIHPKSIFVRSTQVGSTPWSQITPDPWNHLLQGVGTPKRKADDASSSKCKKKPRKTIDADQSVSIVQQKDNPEAIPASIAPSGTVLAHVAPAEVLSAEAALADAAPAEVALKYVEPTFITPVETVSTEMASTGIVSAKAVPAEAFSPQIAPVEAMQSEAILTEAVPAKAAPAEAASTGVTATGSTSAKSASTDTSHDFLSIRPSQKTKEHVDSRPERGFVGRMRIAMEPPPAETPETDGPGNAPKPNGQDQPMNDAYFNRSSAGVYIDRFAKRKIGRGRPRNALIATFRLEHLREFSWFVPEPLAPKPPKKRRKKPVSESDEEDHVSCPDQNEGEATRTETEAIRIDTAVSMQYSNQPVTDTPIFADPPPDRPVAADQAPDQPAAAAQPIADKLAVQTGASTDSPATNKDAPVFKIKAAQDTAPSVLEENQPSTGPHHAPEMVQEKRASPELSSASTWTAVNVATQVADSAYQSPYAPSLQDEPTSTQQSENDGTEEFNMPEAGESQIQGLYSAITEVTYAKASKASSYKGNKLGGGSWVTFRHNLIREIIDMCHGVFPLHGEIGRPFITLWEERHPNIKPPNSSTVLSNLREMIKNPQNGLKKMTFLVKLRQGPALKLREIVAKAHFTTSSPEVTRLAYKMANFSATRSHQFYPEEIRHLVKDQNLYTPMPVAPKDGTISLDHHKLNLDSQIHEAHLKRRRQDYHQRKNEDTARMRQNALVEQSLANRALLSSQYAKIRRMRLASLDDKKKRYRRAPSKSGLDSVGEESGQQNSEPTVQARLVGQTPLEWQEPWVGPNLRKEQRFYASWMTAPIVRFYPNSGTFSTEFGLVRATDIPRAQQMAFAKLYPNKGAKRVRIEGSSTEIPIKRIRLEEFELISSSSTESDEHPMSSSEEDGPAVRSKKETQPKAKVKAKAKAKAKSKSKITISATETTTKPFRKRAAKGSVAPTLLERLTGDSETPYPGLANPNSTSQVGMQPPISRRRSSKATGGKKRKPGYPEPVHKFKIFCSTLVIASSMAGDGAVDWTIVDKVLGEDDPGLAKTKKLWLWVQANMLPQITDLTTNFESRFLDAYEKGEVAAIEDPETYDWRTLVEWTARKCAYKEASLPAKRDDLLQFTVDESTHEVLDRAVWYREKIADATRTQQQIRSTYAAPLHRECSGQEEIVDDGLKARSWIRANTATPYDRYDRDDAHAKLKSIEPRILAAIMGEYTGNQIMRMRKAKRLLPGRNYDFTAKFVRRFIKPFELEDFMDAVQVKKRIDSAFSDADPTKRVYPIAKTEEDGAVMALLSLVSDGSVKLDPQLPPINNSLGAPLPRMSVWGFSEGDYVHRRIDRQRLFWDLHIRPTASYKFGNPILPSESPLSLENTGKAMAWKALPTPPLPGAQDPNAILPVWSSMDGQMVTWPWFYRTLNMILQPLMFQAGATLADIHSHCPEFTVEAFEVVLVMNWLESINAVKKVEGGRWIAMPGIWAAFGERLIDIESDWINNHIKRKTKRHEKQVWRNEYAQQYSDMRQQAEEGEGSQDDVSEDETEANTLRNRDGLQATEEQILANPLSQYKLLQRKNPPASRNQPETPERTATQTEKNTATAELSTDVSSLQQNADVEMGGTGTEVRGVNGDVDMDAEGDEEMEDNEYWTVIDKSNQITIV